jgi:uncharacterized protein (TIGR02594 family)
MGAPNYLMIMKSDLGLKEAPGAADNPLIVAKAPRVAAYLKAHGIAADWVTGFYHHDDIPWCALEVSDCLVRAGILPPSNPLSAGAFRSWGVDVGGPKLGAIAVKHRVGGNHVGLVAGLSQNGAMVLVIAGNADDQVRYDWYPVNGFDAFRAPTGVDLDPAPAVAFDRNSGRVTPIKES